jgi:hypothetical protein
VTKQANEYLRGEWQNFVNERDRIIDKAMAVAEIKQDDRSSRG